MQCREDLPIDRALEDFVAQSQLLEDEFFIEPAISEPIDLTDLVEPYEEPEPVYAVPHFEEVAADPTLPQATIPACIPQRTLVVSMMVTAALSALAVVWIYRPAPAPAIAAAAIPRPRIEVTLPRVEPPKAPAPTVTQLAPAPAPIARVAATPAPVARASKPARKRTMTAKVSRRDWSNGFAD